MLENNIENVFRDDPAVQLLNQYMCSQVETSVDAKVNTLWTNMKSAIKPYIKKKFESFEKHLAILNPLQGRMEEMRLKLGDLQVKVNVHEETIKNLKEEIQSLRYLEDLQVKLVTHDETIAKLREEVRSLKDAAPQLDNTAGYDEQVLDDTMTAEDSFDPEKFLYADESGAVPSFSDVEVDNWGDKSNLSDDFCDPSESMKKKQKTLSLGRNQQVGKEGGRQPTNNTSGAKGRGGRPRGSQNRCESKEALRNQVKRLQAEVNAKGNSQGNEKRKK